jgi:hypothetical protein
MKKGFLAGLILCASITCQASEYFLEPTFNSNERYESNLNMRPIPLRSNWISTLSPALNFGLRHENGEISSKFLWNQLLYNDQSELNRAEQLFSSHFQHTFEQLSLSLGSSYNNQSSLNTEATTSGLLLTQVMNKNLSLTPSVTYTLDELNSLSFNYSYNKATYDKIRNNILSDFTNQQVSATFNHAYSERDNFNASLSGTLYESQRQKTHNYVTQIGWQHNFSEQLSAYVSAGINYSQSESQSSIPQLNFIGTFNGEPFYQDPITGAFYPQQRFETVSTQRNNFGQVYSASITKSFEKGSVSFAGSQNQTPTSVGLQTQQQLTFSTAYTINERWTSGFSASDTKSQLTGQSSNQFNRTYYSISPNINWKWTPEINLVLSYTYRQQEFQGSQASIGNTVQLQFSYQPKLNFR